MNVTTVRFPAKAITFPVMILFLLATLVAGVSEARGGEASAVDADSRIRVGPAARIRYRGINECSGMVFAGGALWAHNDSGGSAVLFRSTQLDFSDAVALEVPGAENVDWEDLAVLDGDILVCDIGDNERKRQNVKVYRVRFEAAANGRPDHLKLIATYPIRYPDGPHDAEAAFVLDGRLFIVIKRRGEPATTLFRLDELRDIWDLKGSANKAISAGQLDLGKGEQITGADYDSDSGTVVLLSYRHIFQYKKTRLTGPPEKKLQIRMRQCESVCFKGKQLIITNEQRDVFVIDDFLAKLIPDREWTP